MILINRSLSLLAIAFLMVFSSCKKDEEAAPDNNSSTITFKANGVSFSCNEDLITASQRLDGGSNDTLMYIGGVTNQDQIINLSLYSNLTNSTIFPDPGVVGKRASIVYKNGIDTKSCSTGTITVTSINRTTKKISGTFNGTGRDLNITEGVFRNISY